VQALARPADAPDRYKSRAANRCGADGASDPESRATQRWDLPAIIEPDIGDSTASLVERVHGFLRSVLRLSS
jgi:hypothetical protein